MDLFFFLLVLVDSFKHNFPFEYVLYVLFERMDPQHEQKRRGGIKDDYTFLLKIGLI